ncbi:ABC transporter permease [Galactobacter sp.]|uniref:ABC transporter permease n=1 Tax=Galactobacter sp. TaxID=2676125 RepID=UPI0025C6E13B|nr:ABC transporter permease [Galactobacter sp.]
MTAVTTEPGRSRVRKRAGTPRRHPLIGYLARRVLISVALAVGVTFVTFILTNLVPGDPVAAALGERAAEDPAAVAQFNATYGLDKPFWQQYIIYLGNLFQGDLGISQLTRNPVSADLAKAVPATLEIALATIVLSLAIGVTLGTWAAHRRGKVTDQVVRVVSLAGLSVPTFWMALMLYYFFYFKWHIAPGAGRQSSDYLTPPHVTGMYTVDALLAGQLDTFVDAAAHLFLPVLVLTLFTVGLLTRFVRTSVLEVLDQDYVRAARAKGLRSRTIVFSYVLRAAAVPIMTMVGIAFGSLLAGTVLVEQIFSWPGLGSYAFKAASNLDLTAIMGVGLVVGIIYLGVNLIVDILYSIVDPRVRLA